MAAPVVEATAAAAAATADAAGAAAEAAAAAEAPPPPLLPARRPRDAPLLPARQPWDAPPSVAACLRAQLEDIAVDDVDHGDALQEPVHVALAGARLLELVQPEHLCCQRRALPASMHRPDVHVHGERHRLVLGVRQLVVVLEPLHREKAP